MKKALGLIETIGLAAAIEACDTALKSANINLIGYELSKGGGMVTVKIEGDVGAVKSAVYAAKLAAEKINKVYTTVVIPRPTDNIDGMIKSHDTVGIQKSVNETKNNIKKDNKENRIKEREGNSDLGPEEKPLEKIKLESNEEVLDKSQIIQTDKEKVGGEKLNNTNKGENLEKPKNMLQGDEDLSAKKVLNEYEVKEIANTKDVCNLCNDPKCPRRKGQPKNLCIHYKK